MEDQNTAAQEEPLELPEMDLGEEQPIAPIVPEGEQPASPPAKQFDFSSLKEVDPDIDENNFLDRYKTTATKARELEQQNKDLSLLAAGSAILGKDEKINNWHAIVKADDADLYKFDEAWKLRQANPNLSEDEIKGKVEAKYARQLEKDPDLIEDRAISIRGMYNENIKTRTNELLKEQQDASERHKARTTSPDTEKKILDQTLDVLKTKDVFMGMKLPSSNPSGVEALKTKTTKFINDGGVEKALSDPATRAEIAMYLANKDKYDANFSKKGKGQSTAPKEKKAITIPATHTQAPAAAGAKSAEFQKRYGGK